MYRHKFYDADGREFYWYSAKRETLYNVLEAAQAWFGRALISA